MNRIYLVKKISQFDLSYREEYPVYDIWTTCCAFNNFNKAFKYIQIQSPDVKKNCRHGYTYEYYSEQSKMYYLIEPIILKDNPKD